MAIENLGFLHETQNLGATWGQQTIRETCLIEMDSPLDDVLDVQNALPAYDSGVTPEPTFTIGLSYHPERSDLVLKAAGSVTPHPSGRPFWLIELVYETATWLDLPLPYEDQGRGNVGRTKRYSGTTAIKYPWDEPPTWSGSTERVKSTVYQDSAGVKLVHANYLPLTEGIDIDVDLEVHQFTWNVEYATFTYSTDIAPYVGRINSSSCFSYAAKNVYLKSCTAVENQRTQSIAVASGESTTGAVATHRFVTLNATFLIDTRGTTHGYFREANRRVSMHTMQLTNVGTLTVPIYAYGPIPINDRGDVAQAPWPLASQAYCTAQGASLGIAYPFASLPTANPETDFFIIDPLYPRTADLAAFVAAHGLTIP